MAVTRTPSNHNYILILNERCLQLNNILGACLHVLASQQLYGRSIAWIGRLDGLSIDVVVRLHALDRSTRSRAVYERLHANTDFRPTATASLYRSAPSQPCSYIDGPRRRRTDSGRCVAAGEPSRPSAMIV